MLEEIIPNRLWVDWSRKKIIKKGLGRGTYYATFRDAEGKEFNFWMTRKDMKKYKWAMTGENPKMTSEATELELWIKNSRRLYTQQHTPIIKNLVRKKAAGIYDSEKAVKLFMYLADNGARDYNKENGDGTYTIPKYFPKSVRLEVASELVKEFETEFELGNYDDFIPKKYRKNPGLLVKNFLEYPWKNWEDAWILTMHTYNRDTAFRMLQDMANLSEDELDESTYDEIKEAAIKILGKEAKNIYTQNPKQKLHFPRSRGRYVRERLISPKKVYHMRTITRGKHKLVVGCPVPVHRGRCPIGTVTQTILHPKKEFKNPSVAWNIYLHGKLIDTVWFDTSYRTAQEVEKSLIEHDGYHPDIIASSKRKRITKENPKVSWKSYKCVVCDNIQQIQTNHTGPVFDYCKNCSWKSFGFDSKNTMDFGGRAFRKFTFVGKNPKKNPTLAVFNPPKKKHSFKGWELWEKYKDKAVAISFAKHFEKESPSIEAGIYENKKTGFWEVYLKKKSR